MSGQRTCLFPCTDLRAEVEVAVYSQYGVGGVLERLREEVLTAALQKLLQQQLRRSVQQGVLTVRGAHVLRRGDAGGHAVHGLGTYKSPENEVSCVMASQTMDLVEITEHAGSLPCVWA